MFIVCILFLLCVLSWLSYPIPVGLGLLNIKWIHNIYSTIYKQWMSGLKAKRAKLFTGIFRWIWYSRDTQRWCVQTTWSGAREKVDAQPANERERAHEAYNIALLEKSHFGVLNAICCLSEWVPFTIVLTQFVSIFPSALLLFLGLE